jgi:crotonobetainyl-CoA:carnitine CoA-transferase CaiB-like acyl-CoA transferase
VSDLHDNETTGGVLAGLRVLDVSLLGPAILAQQLADLGADVVKVEPPGGDHVRKVGWPIIDGAALMHWHVNRGKRSIILDLKTKAGIETFIALVKKADILIEGMRPGALSRRGLTWERLSAENPRLVYCSISGFGSTGPLAQLATHGAGFDAWAGILAPQIDENGTPHFPERRTPIGYFAGSLWGAIGVLAGVIRARATGKGYHFEISQAGAAAAISAMALEAQRYVDRRNASGISETDDKVGSNRLRSSVRLAFYRAKDGYVLFMATEQKFWRNFCTAVSRPDLFAAHPGKGDYDQDYGNEVLRGELAALFKERTMAEWVELGLASDFAVVQAHTQKTLLQDAHFKASMAWLPEGEHPCDLLATPIMTLGEPPAIVHRAPKAGENTETVLKEWLE